MSKDTIETANKELVKRAEKAEKKARKAIEKQKELERENRRLQRKISKLEEAEKVKNVKNKVEIGRGDNAVIPQRVARHHYCDIQILTALLLYVYAGVSLRGVPKVLEVFNKVTGASTGDVPSYTTVDTWVKKAGLSVLRKSQESLDTAYALIVDESISVGGVKVQLGLAVPAQFPGKAITCSDTEVACLTVSKCGSGEHIATLLKGLPGGEERVEYGICDGGKNLDKGFRTCGICKHRDIGHTFGTILEQTYGKDEEFNELTRLVGNTRRWSQTDLAPLMAPNQRSVARFMNLYLWIEWASRMIGGGYVLNKTERYHTGFLRLHASLIDELDEVTSCMKDAMEIAKNQGLSRGSAEAIRTMVGRQLISSGCDRERRIGMMMVDYINEECLLLKSDDDVHVISSDIIESTFGSYKGHMSPNKQYGITTQVLFIPLHTKCESVDGAISQLDICEMFKDTTIGNVREWGKENLPPSPMQLRMQKCA